MTEDVYECTKCGACCAKPGKITIFRKEIYDGLKEVINPALAKSTMPFGKDYTFIPNNDNSPRCLHLQGELGKNVACKIYSDRPAFCRMYEPGSTLCKKVRREVLGIIE